MAFSVFDQLQSKLVYNSPSANGLHAFWTLVLINRRSDLFILLCITVGVIKDGLILVKRGMDGFPLLSETC